jgi:hypothetical protein
MLLDSIKPILYYFRELGIEFGHETRESVCGSEDRLADAVV